MPAEPDPVAVQPAPPARMETIARALMGAGSGGVLGLMLSGFAGRFAGQGLSAVWTVVLTALFAGLLAWLNMRDRQPLPAAPPASLGVALTSGALLLTLAVFLAQSTFVQTLLARGEPVRTPLPIWPVSQAALLLSLVLAAAGMVATFLGWAQSSRQKGKYLTGKWVGMAILSAGAWAALALACYVTGYGFDFAR